MWVYGTRVTRFVVGPWRFSLVVAASLSLLGASLVCAWEGTAAAAENGPESTSVTGNSCHGVFSGNPPGTLVETTSAGPSENTVTPGQSVAVTLTWNTHDFGGNPPAKTDLCVEIGSQISTSLSQEHKPGPGGGTDTYTLNMPDDIGGDAICLRAAVSGPLTSTEKSAVLCYAFLPDAAPEVPNAILLPMAGLLIGGGALLFSRRRRITNQSSA